MSQELVYAMLGKIAIAVIAMAQPLIIYMASRILKRLDDLNTKVNFQNGRVTKVETRMDGHVALVNERHAAIDHRVDVLEKA